VQSQPTQAMPPQGPPGGGTPGAPDRGPWIIAGAIVLVGLLVVIALVLLLRDDDGGEVQGTPSPSPAEETPTPSPTRTRTRTPSPSPSPQPSPTPTADDATLIRVAVQRAAERDRPGEVTHVGNVQFYRNPACATREGGQANVRYTVPPKVAIFIVCESSNGRWKVTQGPIYGE
jgi:hypothetical protein